MRMGTDISVLAEPGRQDSSVLAEHLALADLAEPLGFDSLFALEHHFTGYSMSPAPLQILSYYAGRTKRITLGTCVIVLPWQDPIRVAEQIAYLDLLCRGRCMFGFGRGAASAEYAGFRVPMEEARARFAEAARLVTKALSDEVFEWEGEFYKIPRMSIRPRPMSHPERRFYASSVSPESAEIMAKLGFGMLFIMQNEWSKCREDIEKFQTMSAAAGFAPKAPIILTNGWCWESREEAREKAVKYLGRKWQSIDDHYHFSDGHLANVKGYEAYGKTAKTYAKLKDPANLKKATDFYVSIQMAGTPHYCLQQLGRLQQITGL